MKHSVSIKARLALVMLIMTVLLMLVAHIDAPSSAQEPSPTPDSPATQMVLEMGATATQLAINETATQHAINQQNTQTAIDQTATATFGTPTPTSTPQTELMLGIPPDYGELRDTIHTQVARFEAETGIKVFIDDDYGGPTYWDRADMSLQLNDYDVVFVSADLLNRWERAGHLLPMDGLIEDEDDFYPAVLDAVRVNGTLYCIPRDAWSMALFYNRDSFDKALLEYPTDDWTWDDLRENSQLLLEANSEPLILDGYIDYWTSFLYQAGGRLTDSETGAWAFNSPEGLEALTFYFDLYRMGHTPDEDRWLWGGSEFSANRAGMTVQGNWMMYTFMEDDYSTVDWGTVELPSHRAEGTIVSSQCYGVASQTQNREASVLLANYLTNAESQTELFFTSGLPSRMSLSEAYIDYWVNRASEKGLVWQRDDIQTFFDSLNHGFPLQSFSVGDRFQNPLYDMFWDAFQRVLNGEMTAQEMLNQLDTVVITEEP
ncbi:MAG: sugar ABC transporter substrate-binding protein [bacterium]|nr:sugar ABC transporter substrate-binding protein [bacterium]